MTGFRHCYLTDDYKEKKCDCLTHVLASTLPRHHIESAVILRVWFDYRATLGLVVYGRDIVWVPGTTAAYFIYVFGETEDTQMFTWATFAQKYSGWNNYTKGRFESPKVLTHWPSFRMDYQLFAWLRKILALPTTIEQLITLSCSAVFLDNEL